MKTKLELSGLGNLKWRNHKRQILVKTIYFFLRKEQLISSHKNNCTTIGAYLPIEANL